MPLFQNAFSIKKTLLGERLPGVRNTTGHAKPNRFSSTDILGVDIHCFRGNRTSDLRPGTILVKPCHGSDAIWIVFSSHPFISGFKAVDNTTSIYSSFGWFHLQNFWALGETTSVIASNAKIETRSTRIQKRCAWLFALANGWCGSFSACGRWHVETTVPEQGLMVGTNQNQNGHLKSFTYVSLRLWMIIFQRTLVHPKHIDVQLAAAWTLLVAMRKNKYFTVTWPCSALSFKLQGEILFLKVQCLIEHVSILVEDPKHFKICLTKKCEVGFLSEQL